MRPCTCFRGMCNDPKHEGFVPPPPTKHEIIVTIFSKLIGDDPVHKVDCRAHPHNLSEYNYYNECSCGAKESYRELTELLNKLRS